MAALIQERDTQEREEFDQFRIVCANMKRELSKSVGDTEGIFIFGFKTHDVIAGSRSSTINFLIRQIFKWAGALWTHATQPEDCVKRNPVINFYYFSLLTLILVRTLRVSIKKFPLQWFLQWMSFCLHIFATGFSLSWWQLPTATTCQSHWIKTFIYCSQGNVIISVMVSWLL